MMAKTLSSNTFTCVKKYKSVNIHFYISSRATLRRISRLHMIAFCPKHPKWDQNPKFTPLSETKSIPPLFIWESPPPPPGTALPYRDVAPKRQFVDVPNSSCWPWELLSSALTSSLHLSNSCWPLSESLASHSFHARSDLHGVLHLHPLRINSGVIRHAWSPTATFSLSRIPLNNFGVSWL